MVKRVAPLLVVLASSSVAFGIVRRDDVEDTAYIVDANEFPAVADLLEPGDCLATLITPEWAVSAAHCVRHLELPHTLTFGDETVGVRGKVCNERFDGQRHDIALVHLERPVSAEPIPLFRGDDELGQRVVLVGRGDTATGITGQDGATLDFETRRATNTVFDVTSRWIKFRFDAPSDPGVTELEGISGDGDSGGPAFIDSDDGLRIAGISAYQDASGARLGKYGVTEVYTRVSRYQSFVDEVTGDDWDGEYQGCDTCSASGAPSGSFLALVGIALLRKRRQNDRS